jgi:hypothetical protein
MNNTNYAQNNSFQLVIPRFEGVAFYSQEFQLPSISLPAVRTGNPFKRIVSAGDTMEYSPLVFTFLVDENMENYQKVVTWIQRISYSNDFPEFTSYEERNATQYLGEQDISLIVLNSKNNPVKTFTFVNAIPTSVGGPELATNLTGTEYMRAQVVFEYDYFDIK